MISKRRRDNDPREAYAWIWLPNAAEPVVAGRISRDGDSLVFNYGQSYLERPDAISLYEPELPLRRGLIKPKAGLGMAGCLRDGSPDAWGRRVILNLLLGRRDRDVDTDELDELTCLLKSSSDRTGALDFQASPTDYQPRSNNVTGLDELLQAAEKVQNGIPLAPEPGRAMLHGTSLGGARPKDMIEDDDRKLIAKFSLSTDTYNVVKAEFAAMRLAARVGLDVAPVRLEHVAGKDVLLVERFDRLRASKGWQRRAMVSALTLFGLDEMMARYASYEEMANIVRHRFTRPNETLRELFGRLVFNILCGNTCDHARNHAAFWDGARLALTPAYDICPQHRTGNEATQAMLIMGNDRMSKLATCLDAAHNFHLDRKTAEDLIADQIERMRAALPEVAEEARLTEVDRELLFKRIFLNPFIFQDAPAHLSG